MRSRLTLWISISLNIFLVVLLMSGRQRQSRQSEPSAPSIDGQPVVAQSPPLSESPPAAAATADAANLSSWKELKTDDLEAFVQKLRDAEFPEATVRDIVFGEVDRSFKLKKLTSIVLPDLEWWESGADERYQESIEAPALALKKERDEALMQLLGENWDRGRPSDFDIQPLYGPELSALEPGVAMAAREIERQFSSRIAAHRRAREISGEPVAESELGKLREARRLALAELLNEKQLQAYLLRFSERAREIRRELARFNATSNEFLKIFQIRDRVEREIQLKHGGADSESAALRRGLEAQGNAEIKAELGAVRYQAYQYNLDPLYRNALAFVETYGGNPAKVLHLYELSHMSKAQRNQIERDATKNEPEREQEIGRARTQLEGNLKQILGPEAYRKYRESGADLLDSLPR